MKIDNDQENFNQSVGSSRNVPKENASNMLLSASRGKKGMCIRMALNLIQVRYVRTEILQ
ncbi:unnamed protein product [Debaryomyces tyrocola]|nr:unnamed protein product [Debaryomyces tyrocola]